MSGHTVPADISGHMLDLDEDEDLEVFSKNTSLTDEGPVPNSPSSMVNQYRLEDDEEQQDANAKDLFISVEDPESHITAIETYIMYRVATKTTRSDFDSSEFEVRRRYQDFLWLRSKLEESHPTLIVHPLPEKFVMKGMVERFNDDFIETRRKALQRFLSRISEHPVLSHSQHFKVFLTAQDLAPHKKQGSGFLSRMGETMRAVANSVRGVKNRPEEFDVLQEYVENFSNKISSVDKVTQRIIKEQREYLDELRQYSSTYSQWAESEENLSEPLKGVASCAGAVL
ncbi:Sorting nexin-7 [Oryzias melastigma]|uniref:Sorting nexin-7 n=1 Tax=Oryzias melastigma TaxID=30732 RepID=A0A834FKP0_ORYME|nr:Sorting nexin-7 [Oryzias melastigma]